MSKNDICALVLAGGKGTRMHSDKPKVLHTLLGEPMLHYVYEGLAPLLSENIFTVVGFGRDQVENAFPQRADRFVVQDEQFGTGHALQCAWERLESSGCKAVLVVNGDTPLVGNAPLEGFIEAVTQGTEAHVSFMSITLKNPGSFGRVIRTKGGQVQAIVEAKDYDVSKHRAHSGEVNAGVYLLRMDAARKLLPKLKNENKSGEYYITDLIDLAVNQGLVVMGYNCGSDPSLMGVNGPRELAQAEFSLRRSVVSKWLDKGVIIHSPESVVIGPRVELAPGAEIFGPTELYGNTRVEAGAVVSSNCWIMDTLVQKNAFIRQFCHFEDAKVGPDAVVGPYARLRPGATLAENSRVGNFCELKKSTIGAGSKVNHLSYVGDSEIGKSVNIGAGTITCNYDGTNKFKTTIEDGAFIGSNSALVAPVTVGKGAVVGAGSVITKDVPDKSLAVSRTRQKNIEGRGKP